MLAQAYSEAPDEDEVISAIWRMVENIEGWYIDLFKLKTDSTLVHVQILKLLGVVGRNKQ